MTEVSTPTQLTISNFPATAIIKPEAKPLLTKHTVIAKENNNSPINQHITNVMTVVSAGLTTTPKQVKPTNAEPSISESTPPAKAGHYQGLKP